MADLGRYEARGKGLPCAQGIEVQVMVARRQLDSSPHDQLKEWIKEQLVVAKQKIEHR